MDVSGPAGTQWRGQGPSAVERATAAARQDARQAGRQRWLEQVRDTLSQASPAVDTLAAHPIDPIALGEAREHIAQVLAEVDQLQQSLGHARSALAARMTPVPISPGASDAAVAAAQAVAEMIAANAKPAIEAQAALPADAVRSVMR